MSRIKSKNTGIDLIMRDILDGIGIKYLTYPSMYGSPDFVLPRKKIVIYCDGDFWHGYGYNGRKYKKKFWRDKITSNMKRDKKYSRKLRRDGWSVLRFWGHDITRDSDKCKRKILCKIKNLNKKTDNVYAHHTV